MLEMESLIMGTNTVIILILVLVISLILLLFLVSPLFAVALIIVLMLTPYLVSVLFAVVLVILIVLLLYLVSPIFAPKKMPLEGAHVLVTGGSSGIGKCVAIEAAKCGASVTLLARNQTRLAEARDEVEQHLKVNQKVTCISVDVTKDYAHVEKAIRQAEEAVGHSVDMLVNSAGYSVANRFEDIPAEDFRKMIEANYLGSVYSTRAVVCNMKKRKIGRIVFLSSQAGQIGLYGYTGYSASKFALRGLAEALQMEVQPYNIYVTMSCPPDTDTPGFQRELEAGQPKETRLISEVSGLFSAEQVAKTIVADSVSGKFVSYIGVDGFLLACLTCGMSPVSTVAEALLQVCLVAVFRVIGISYHHSFARIVKDCMKERETEKDKLH